MRSSARAGPVLRAAVGYALKGAKAQLVGIPGAVNAIPDLA
jgi:hypothetical protein